MSLKKQYKEAQLAYYAGAPIMSDAKFDKLEDKIKKLDPDWEGFKKAGSEKIGKKRKVTLQNFMPSLSKAYPEAIDRWLAKQKSSKLMVMDKLDGSSIQAYYEGGKLKQLVTRGDGTIGQDITFLAKHTTLPQKINTKRPTSFRIEAIMPKDVFEANYADSAENARNLVAGILNRKLTKDSTAQLHDVNFVVLGVYGHDMKAGMQLAMDNGFYTPVYDVVKCTKESLSKYLKTRLKKGQYEMDGLVLVSPKQVFQYDSADKPKWTVAFKENVDESEAPVVKVLDVIWQSSPVGRLTPKVVIEPTRMNGVTVKFATAHNAKWMQDRGIGPGARIKIVRSGDVIPKIIGVDKPAKKFKGPDCEYEQRGVHFWMTERTEEVAVKNITKFLVTCGVERVKDSTVETLYKSGLDSLTAAARIASTDDRTRLHWLGMVGFKSKSARIINDELKKLQEIHIIDAMVGSGIWPEGLGRRRLEMIAAHIPLSRLLNSKDRILREKIASIPGFGVKSAKMVVDGLAEYRVLHEALLEYIAIATNVKKKAEVEATGSKWAGLVGCWTGYRSKDQEAEFVANGGTIANFSSKTTHLFYKEGGKKSTKVEKAGNRATTWEQFIKG